MARWMKRAREWTETEAMATDLAPLGHRRGAWRREAATVRPQMLTSMLAASISERRQSLR